MEKLPASVISILTWDGYEYVSRLLDNLDSVPIGMSPFAITILDQGSDDKVVSALKAFAYDKNHVSLELANSNKGFSVGHNRNFARCWSSSPFDYFVVVNSDAIFEEENWLDKLVGHMEDNPGTGGAGPHVLGMRDDGHGRAATAKEISERTFKSVSACIAIYRCKDICELGLFDAKFTPGYFEDTDLSFRYNRYGRDMDHVPVEFKHCYLGKQYSTSGIKRKELLAKYGDFQERNRLEFLNRWVVGGAAPKNSKELVQAFPTLYFPGRMIDSSRVIEGPIAKTENGFSYDIGKSSRLIIHPSAKIRARAHFEIYDGGTVRIGANAVVGVNNWVQGNGGVEIGANTLIGANTVLLSTMHGVDKDLPVRDQPLRKAKLTIASDVLIGANVTIAAGILLSEGAVIGSNSFVHSNVDSYGIVGGVPAIHLRHRENPRRDRKALAVVAVGNSDRPNRFNTHTDFFVSVGNALLDYGVESYYLCHPESRGDVNRIPPARQFLAPDHNEFEKILDEVRPDWIYIWNGNSDGDKVTQEIARQRDIPVIFSELGWFTQKDSVYFDGSGTNANSEIRKLDLSKVEEHPELDDWIAAYLSNHIRQPVAGPSYVFVPLQDESDTNILQFSPYKKMNDFVEELATRHPEKLFVVRPHPKAPSRSIRQHKNVKIIEGGKLYDWLASADSVVGINSTVLLEALLLGKAVHSVGTGLVTGLDVFFEYDSARDINLDQRYDAMRWERRRKLLSELVFRRQIRREDASNPQVLKSHPVLAKFL